MIRIIIALTIFTLLISCATTVSYSSGKVEIAKVSDNKLVDDAVKQKRYLTSLLSAQEAQLELNIILAELDSRHPNWQWEKIYEGRVDVGMTKSEVLLCWGKPYSTNKEKAYWIYKMGNSKRRINFAEGKVKGVFVTQLNNVQRSSKSF